MMAAIARGYCPNALPKEGLGEHLVDESADAIVAIDELRGWAFEVGDHVDPPDSTAFAQGVGAGGLPLVHRARQRPMGPRLDRLQRDGIHVAVVCVVSFVWMTPLLTVAPNTCTDS